MSGVTLHPLGEVLAAARALSAGEFRQGPARPRPAVRPAVDPSVPAGWSPEAGERLVVVAGCGGGAGASTVALGVAQAAGVARVVETCTRAASGLVAATSAELGETDGWLRGTRGPVVVERRGDRLSAPQMIPAPLPAGVPVTVVDSSWDLDLLVQADGWLAEAVRGVPGLILTARPTIASARRLEAAVGLCGPARTVAVLVGAGRRLPRELTASFGPELRGLAAAGRLLTVPFDAGLALTGLTPDVLPAAVVAACSRVLETLTKGTLR